VPRPQNGPSPGPKAKQVVPAIFPGVCAFAVHLLPYLKQGEDKLPESGCYIQPSLFS